MVLQQAVRKRAVGERLLRPSLPVGLLYDAMVTHRPALPPRVAHVYLKQRRVVYHSVTGPVDMWVRPTCGAQPATCRRPPRLPYFAGDSRFVESFVCIVLHIVLHARLPSFMVHPRRSTVKAARSKGGNGCDTAAGCIWVQGGLSRGREL